MNAQTISLIITCGFIGLLVIGFFVGFWRGAKRSLMNLIFAIVAGVGAFFLTPVITNALLDITITSGSGASMTIQQFFVDLLSQNSDINRLMTASTGFKQLVYGLPGAIANAVVFIVLVMVLEGIFYIIYKIACIFVKYKPEQKKHRVLGAAIGAIKTFLLVVFAFMPLASLIGMANQLTEREGYIVTTSTTAEQTGNEYGMIGELLPAQAIGAVKGAEGSLLTKVCGFAGMDDAMFDYLSAVEVNEEKVNVRDEVVNYYEILAVKYDLEHTVAFDIKDVNYQKLEVVLDNIVNSTCFENVVSEILADMIQNVDSYSFLNGLGEYKTIIDKIAVKLKNITDNGGKVATYFSSDLKQIFSVVRALGENGVIDNIKKLEDKSAQSIMETLTNSANKTHFDNAVNGAFKINMVKDSIAEILKLATDKIQMNLGNVDVDTTSWNEDKWTATATALSKVVKDFADLGKLVDFNDVISNPTILLDENSNYDIPSVMRNLGTLIDDARKVDLLQTAEGKSIFDQLLADNNISLPTTAVRKADGTSVTISSYLDLFSFISPALDKLKTSGLYSAMDSQTDTLISIAQIICQAGNENVLNEVILPLNQVEPTKTILESLISNFGGTMIDFSVLNGFDEWNADLTYISSILSSLNVTKNADGKTYLSLVVEGDVAGMFNSLTDAQVDEIIQPILYAKSTSSLKDDLLSQIASGFNEITGANNTLSQTNVTFSFGNVNDQTSELCEVIKKLIAVNAVYTPGDELKDIDRTVLTAMLTSLQANAYRTTYDASNSDLASENKRTQNGIFSEIFLSVMTKLKAEISQVGITYIENNTSAGVGYFEVSNYPNIVFEELFGYIDQIPVIG